MARAIARTEDSTVRRMLRKTVEMVSAQLKRIPGLGGLRLRGPQGAKDEFRLAATARTLRKRARLRPMPKAPGNGADQGPCAGPF